MARKSNRIHRSSAHAPAAHVRACAHPDHEPQRLRLWLRRPGAVLL